MLSAVSDFVGKSRGLRASVGFPDGSGFQNDLVLFFAAGNQGTFLSRDILSAHDKREHPVDHALDLSGDGRLEADGLIIRTEYPQIPPKVEYSLSERGKSLMPNLDKMCEWGDENRI